MLRITDFAQRGSEDPKAGMKVFEMMMAHGFKHDIKNSEFIDMSEQEAKQIPNKIMNDLTQCWNKHVYGEIVVAMEVLRKAIIENAKAIDKTGEEQIQTTFANVMNLCQIQPPEEKQLIQVPGERGLHSVN